MKLSLPQKMCALFSAFSLLAQFPMLAHDHGGGHAHFSSGHNHYDHSHYDHSHWDNHYSYNRVYINDPWYHPDHVYYYDGAAYPNYYNGFPYYYYDPRWYYDGAPGLHININSPY